MDDKEKEHLKYLIDTQDEIEKFMWDFLVHALGIHCTSSYEFNVRVHRALSIFSFLQEKRTKRMGYLIDIKR